ncbi:hypothetical protein [Vibrio methylphosphonaticus]|uniref:hypothetical protein n=1 Tax=Vibrio methylphosphonaticus TaxID=2946866 RepID=UPI00202A29FA|nr:hypothetical protein [Vibrio methylphosphonaticus]MCL9776255.1 hypothetical protein [Vibrio methylphosphonaticus]
MKLAVLLLSMLPALAQAHYGMMECWLSNEGEALVCQAGWTDGTGAPNYDIELYDYDETLLAREVTNSESLVTFQTPTDDFFVVFDSGHEYAVEVDVEDVKEVR